MLQDLSLLVQPIKDKLNLFSGMDCELPEEFKNRVQFIGKDRIKYGKYTSIVTNIYDQHIFISNNWFYIAAALAPLYVPFEEYRTTINRVVSSSALKDKDKEKIKNEIDQNLGLNSEEKEYLKKFGTDYSWWTCGAATDGKSLDRNDCLTSAVLAIANVVNNSQSYLAILWSLLGKDPVSANLLNARIDNLIPSQKVVARSKKLRDFILLCMKYFESIDKLSAFIPYAFESKSNIIKFQSNDFPEKLGGILIETDLQDINRRNTGTITSRWFDYEFDFNGKTVFLSNQWNETGNFELTLPSFKKYVDVAYKSRFFIDKTNTGEFILIELDDTTFSATKNYSYTFDMKQPLQQIFYGAPGTGKSHSVCEVTKNLPKEDVFRITFHPDSDYASFVGCYKPTETEGFRYGINGVNTVKMVDPDNGGAPLVEKKITYRFVPQAFINAYVRAYHTDSPVFLVIEEINRGNCAQIFGDMFQLLDRGDSGESDYAIKPDSDIQDYLSKVMADAHTDDEAIKRGEEMKLPANLFIWATMNTSDQSLFPIDSAFKRRWDWKYMPIDTTKEQWAIKVNGKDYSWGSFLDQVNDEIGETTSSEDKKLGFYFCKASDKTITAERFVSKVLFYIYNDVFKDYGLDSREFFKDKETGKVITFQSLFNMDGSVKEPQVEKILTNLKVTVVSASTSTNEETENDAIDSDTKGDHKESLVAVTIDGERIASATQFDTYLNALKKIGIDRMGPAIEALKYQRRGSKMATKTKEPSIETATGYSYVEADGYYFVKGMNGYTMVRILEDLNKAYDLNLQIEYK